MSNGLPAVAPRPAHAAAEFDGPEGDTPHSAVELQLDLPDGLGACESGSDASGGGGDDWLLARPSPRASAPCSPRPARGEARRPKPLTLVPLVALIFYEVSGGPFGIEDAVSEGAPLLAVLGFLVLPIVWSVPEALVTAELATAFPENSGYVAWVTAAFGPFWGFQEGWLSWISGVTDNAVYPAMFLSYLRQLAPGYLQGTAQRFFFLLFLNLALTYVNWRGLTVVGRAAVGMAAFTLLPFVAMTALGLPHVNPVHWVQVDWGSVKWLPFLNVMFWNLNYWDSVSTLAGEVANPSRTFPRALFGAVALVVVSYLVPLLVGLGVTTSTRDWQLGYFADVAQLVGGRWLAWWVVAAAAVSQIGQFQAEMSSDSFQLAGMAARGFLPAAFNARSRHGTPTLAIALSSLGILAVSSLDFLQIVELLNIVYCLAEFLELLAFIWLRIKYPQLVRPFRVPLPTWGCVLMVTPASALLAVMVLAPAVQGDTLVVTFTCLVCLAGVLLFPLLRAARCRGWCRFAGMSPLAFKELLYTMAPIDHPTHAHTSGASEQDGALLSSRSTNDQEGSSAVR